MRLWAEEREDAVAGRRRGSVDDCDCAGGDFFFAGLRVWRLRFVAALMAGAGWRFSTSSDGLPNSSMDEAALGWAVLP